MLSVPDSYLLENVCFREHLESPVSEHLKRVGPKAFHNHLRPCFEILTPQPHLSPTGSDSLAWAWTLEFLILILSSSGGCQDLQISKF